MDHTTSKLPYAKRKDIFNALDWYHVKSLWATKDKCDNPYLEICLTVVGRGLKCRRAKPPTSSSV